MPPSLWLLGCVLSGAATLLGRLVQFPAQKVVTGLLQFHYGASRAQCLPASAPSVATEGRAGPGEHYSMVANLQAWLEISQNYKGSPRYRDQFWRKWLLWKGSHGHYSSPAPKPPSSQAPPPNVKESPSLELASLRCPLHCHQHPLPLPRPQKQQLSLPSLKQSAELLALWTRQQLLEQNSHVVCPSPHRCPSQSPALGAGSATGGGRASRCFKAGGVAGLSLLSGLIIELLGRKQLGQAFA